MAKDKTKVFEVERAHWPIFVVNRESKVWEELSEHFANDSITSGSMIPLSEEAFKSFKDNVIEIRPIGEDSNGKG